MLLTKTIFVRASFDSSYYESLGYEIPKHIVGSHKKLMVSRNYMLEIKIEHLKLNSNLKIEYLCDKCNNKFITQYYNYNKANKIKGDLCRRCAHKEFASGKNHHHYGKTDPVIGNFTYEHLKGNKNHNWNPELTDEERYQKRDTLENINWRKAIYARDNYKCQICSSKDLEAHHLNGYTEFKDQRFNIENGITLCKSCHKDYHKTFGYKNSTKEKFDLYLKKINLLIIN